MDIIKKYKTIFKILAVVIVLLILYCLYASMFRSSGATIFSAPGEAAYSEGITSFGAMKSSRATSPMYSAQTPSMPSVVATKSNNINKNDLLMGTQKAGLEYIRNFSLSISAEEPQQIFRAIRDITSANNGMVVRSDINNVKKVSYSHGIRGSNKKTATYSYNVSGSMELFVPEENASTVINAITQLNVKVTSRTATVEEVSGVRQDIQARIDTLNTIKAQYLNILKDAKRVNDILDLTDRISELDYTIDSMSADNADLAKQIKYVRINVSVYAPTIAVPVKEWSAYQTYLDASQSLINFLQQLATFSIWLFIYVLPLGLIAGIAALIIFKIYRKFYKVTL